MVELDLAVDDGQVNSFRKLIGDGIRGAVNNLIRVEDDDVGEIADTEQAAILKVLAFGRKRSEFSNRGFERSRCSSRT